MLKHKYTLALLTLMAAAIAGGWATQPATLIIAGSKGDMTLGRDSSLASIAEDAAEQGLIAGSNGDLSVGRESSLAGTAADAAEEEPIVGSRGTWQISHATCPDRYHRARTWLRPGCA